MANNFFVILGNQLFEPKVLKAAGCDHVFMAEDYDLCTYQKHHKLKIYLFLCSMREYRDELQRHGIKVSYFELEERTEATSYLELLMIFVKKYNVDNINFFEIEDQFFENTVVTESRRKGLKIKFHPSPMFMFSREEFKLLHHGKKTFRLANFYKIGRKKYKILIDDNLEPLGNKWSFDEENRKKIPKGVSIPKLSPPTASKYHKIISSLIERHFPDHLGGLDNIWFPVNRQDVENHLNFFFS